MIYITGDTHGNFGRFTKRQRSALPMKLTERDYVIICGDCGICWADDTEFQYNCDWLSRLPFTLLFVDGNHENHTMLTDYPVELWKGGKVHHIVKDKIIHLMRGQVFTLEEKKFFTFGGASSHDMEGGILDREDSLFLEKKKQLKKRKLFYRVIGETWWKEELPSQAELEEGRRNLEQIGYQVDYVISHCTSNRVQKLLAQNHIKWNSPAKVTQTDILTDYFEELEDKLRYKQWFCGHYHQDIAIDEKHRVVYSAILPLKDS
ncbi:MAG: metallophosphoesterase [Lachnospiraceae bacterium]|nr:metallophosphoesterase [Lachnospiraceae bacterium]